MSRHRVALLGAALRDAQEGGRVKVERRGGEVRVTVDHPDGSRTVMELSEREWSALNEEMSARDQGRPPAS